MAQTLLLAEDGLWLGRVKIADLAFDLDGQITTESALAVSNRIRSARMLNVVVEFENDELRSILEVTLKSDTERRLARRGRVWTEEERDQHRAKRQAEARAREEGRAGGSERSGTSQEPPV